MMERAKLRRRLQFLIQLQQLRRLRRAKVKKRRCWIREIFQGRAGYGAFETLFNCFIQIGSTAFYRRAVDIHHQETSEIW